MEESVPPLVCRSVDWEPILFLTCQMDGNWWQTIYHVEKKWQKRQEGPSLPPLGFNWKRGQMTKTLRKVRPSIRPSGLTYRFISKVYNFTRLSIELEAEKCPWRIWYQVSCRSKVELLNLPLRLRKCVSLDKENAVCDRHVTLSCIKWRLNGARIDKIRMFRWMTRARETIHLG